MAATQARGGADPSCTGGPPIPSRTEPPAAGGHGIAVRATVLLTTWAVLAGLFTAGGEVIEHWHAALAMDARITAFVVAHRTPELNAFMKAMTWTGSWLAALALTVVIGVLVWRRRLGRLAVIVVLAGWLGEQLAVSVAKSVVRRPRPPEGVRLVVTHGWSFPSGHTANSVVVFATTAALVITFFAHRRISRVLTWVACALMTVLVGFSRIELAAHWTTDVAASAAWTTGWLLVVMPVVAPGSNSPFKEHRATAGTRADPDHLARS